jgi:hypothetical protein
VGTRNFFLSPQPQFRNLKETPLQSQFHNFLKKCCFATATLQFRNRNFFLSPQLESFTSAIFDIFLAVESGQFMKKKSEVKILGQLSLYCNFFIFRETDSSKNIFG